MKLTDAEKAKRREYYQANKQKFIDKAIEWKKANPEKAKESSRKSQAKLRNTQSRLEKKALHVSRMYGCSIEEYQQMYAEQTGQCKICKTSIELMSEDGTWSKTANIDHNHTTGKIRALLCNSCNRGLGLFKDNSSLLRKAAEYLDAFN